MENHKNAFEFFITMKFGNHFKVVKFKKKM